MTKSDTLFNGETNPMILKAADRLQEEKNDIVTLYWALHKKIAETEYSNRRVQEADLTRLGRLADAMRLMQEAKNALSNVCASSL